MTRYPLALRLIHWVTALVLIPMLAGGYFWLRPMASNDPAKLDALTYHMAIGVGLASLTLIRLILRWRLPHPQTTGLALWAHRGLYLFVLLMPVSGITMVFSAHLNAIVFGRNGAPLPVDLTSVTGHFWHGATALALTAIIALHVAGSVTEHDTMKKML